MCVKLLGLEEANMRRFCLTLAALTLIGCGGHHGHSHSGEGIEISNARINPPLPGQSTGVAFMRLDNHGEDDRLLAITSPVSGRIELHTHLNDGGIMQMRRVDGIALPHGDTVELKPGGFHVMLFETTATLGEEAVLTLDFEKAEDLTVVAPIVLRGETDSGSHSKSSDHGSSTKH
jgi:copper(I)-binding protein